jgi:ribosomal-protein-alanine N-acetyltransferase
MLREQFLLEPVKYSYLKQIEQISSKCKLNLWTAEDYKDELNRSDTFSLACKKNDSENIIGFMFARQIRKFLFDTDVNYDKYDKDNEAEILNIAVLPEYQKRGIGQLILDFFTKFCIENRINVIWLEVRKSNIQAQAFYYKNRFQISYSRKNYYRNPTEDALILKMNLFSDLNSKIIKNKQKLEKAI